MSDDTDDAGQDSIVNNDARKATYEDVQLNAVLRRVYLEHKVWLKDQPRGVQEFFEGDTFGEDLTNAASMIDYSVTEAPEDMSYAYAVGGIYGVLMATLRVIDMLDDTSVSDVISGGRELHAAIGAKLRAPVQVCDVSMPMISEWLESNGYGFVFDSDDEALTVIAVDGSEVLRAEHGEYIQFSEDGEVRRYERE